MCGNVNSLRVQAYPTQFFNADHELLIGQCNAPQPDKGAHDQHACLNGSSRTQHVRQHQATMFGEDQRQTCRIQFHLTWR